MKTLFFVCAILLIFTSSATAQILRAEELANSVVFLGNPKTGKAGSGSFFVHDNRLYLLTATHVAVKLDGRSVVLMGDKNSNPTRFEIRDLILSPFPKWKYHPIADLAILEIFADSSNYKQLEHRFIPSHHFARAGEVPTRETRLTAFGFPIALGVSASKVSALTRNSNPASGLLSLPRFDDSTRTADVFVTEDPSIGGMSGGPVYDLAYQEINNATMYGNKTILFGIVHGTLSDDTGGKLGAITPIYFVFDLLR